MVSIRAIYIIGYCWRGLMEKTWVFTNKKKAQKQYIEFVKNQNDADDSYGFFEHRF